MGGPSIMSIIMRTLAVILFAAAATATFGGESFEDAFSAETEFVQETPEMNEVKDLMSAVHKLRSHAPQHLSEHVRVVAKHAKTLQLSQDSDEEEKANAYTHNFLTASKSIKAALDTLRKELKTGHNHDVKKNNAYVAATKAHNNAIVVHEQKMAAFKTAMKLEAKSTHDACRAAHGEYEALKKDVASNVETRKQVDISSRVVQCYVDHMTNNAAAKACADKARKADMSIWNINGGSLAGCESTSSLENAFGPPSWTASVSNCAKKDEEDEEDEEVEEFDDN